MLRAKLARGKLALLNLAQDEGLIVRYAGGTIALARARDDDGDDIADEANVRARFALSSPGAVLQLTMELRLGSARVRIAAGAQSFDSGEIALGGVQAGERYRIRLAAVKLKGKALSGLVDDVQLTVPGGGAPLAVTTHYVYDAQGRLIGEYTGQGALMREYAYLQDLPLALFEPSGAVFFVHADHLNTPRVITDQNQRVVWRWDNTEPFGSNVANEDPDADGTKVTCNLRFPGQYFDRETNNHYNYFRDYSPEIGRYVQSDPIGLGGGLNTFAYVGGKPVGFVDPLGLAQCTFSMATGRLNCAPNNWSNAPVNIQVASGNNANGMQCQNNPSCTSILDQGPIPLGCWRWTSGSSTKQNGRVLVPCPGTSTNVVENRTDIQSHSCQNPFGPGVGPNFCSKGCLTGTVEDIQALNRLIDSESSNTLQVVQ